MSRRAFRARQSADERLRHGIGSDEWRARYGPWAVVTGGSRGIGHAFADRLAAAGLHVALVGRSGTALATAAGALRARHGVQSADVVADLAEPEGGAAVTARTRDLDVGLVVLSAGDGCEGAFAEHVLEDERRVVRLNVLATLELSHTFARRLKQRGRGGLIVVSSMLAYQGAPYAANYAATKAYALVLAESLHFELRSHGVDVLAVAPGPTRTAAASRVDQQRLPSSQWCTADHVADTALAALGRRASVVPGALNNLLVWAGGLQGREARSYAIGRVAENVAGARDA
jgi:short-subunit dehydrogenase